MMNGRGVYRGVNDSVYEGEWKDDKANGHGVYRYADGGIYEGGFNLGKMNEHGVYRAADERAYEGGWKDGKKHGHEVFRYADGSIMVLSMKKSLKIIRDMDMVSTYAQMVMFMTEVGKMMTGMD
jgi:hypothetical protein